ncbi:hypothetical protein HD806DRAFT_391387 [Xylariaceae sp. AK1471]|nr:hypothetical protein HD806DRAFT_391387 [Xylariaceae sp. AK1471]
MVKSFKQVSRLLLTGLVRSSLNTVSCHPTRQLMAKASFNTNPVISASIRRNMQKMAYNASAIGSFIGGNYPYLQFLLSLRPDRSIHINLQSAKVSLMSDQVWAPVV